jgi:PAS domain S-box-containing protein
LSLAIDGNDRPIFAMRAGEGESQLQAGDFGAGVGNLLRAARAQEPKDQPVPATGLVRIEGKLHAVGVSRLAPEHNAWAPPTPDPMAALLLARKLDAEVLQQIGIDYGLPGLSDVTGGSGAAFLPLVGADGESLGGLTWQATQPGDELWHATWPVLALGTLAIVAALLSFQQVARLVLRRIAANAARLTRSEARLSAVFNQVADAVLTTDAAGRIVSANPATLVLFGLSGAGVEGRGLGELLLEDMPTGEWLARRGAGAQTPAERHCLARRADGRRFVCDVSVTPLAEGAFNGFVVVLRDLSQGQGAAAMLNTLAAGVLAVDAGRNLLRGNSVGDRLLAAADALRLNEGRITCARPQDDAELERAIAQVIAQSDGTGDEVRFVQVERPGGKRPLAVLVGRLPADLASGQPPAAVLYVRDPEATLTVPAELLIRAFRLSPAESRVVAELVGGKSPQEVAVELELSLNTVRNHLKQAFRKTGTSRQSELVSLVLGTTALMPARPAHNA